MRNLTLIFLVLGLSACTTTPKQRPLKFACPGNARLDGACQVNIALNEARDVPDMFQKDQLRALAQAKAYLDHDPNVVLQIQGHSNDQGMQIAAFAKKYVLSLGADPDRISTVAFDGDHQAKPGGLRVILVMWPRN